MNPFKCFFISVGLSALTACSGSNAGNSFDPDPVSPAPNGSISGTVRFNGSTLAGAAVSIFDTNTHSLYRMTTTDSNGRYTFLGIKTAGDVPVEYHVWATKAGYGFYPSVGSGAKVVKADYTGQFTGNGVTDTVIYFTVIDYVALPDASLTGANFSAYNGSNTRVNLASTGQTVSYASGDDGALKKGVVWPGPRFADNQDGTVTDNLTGLVWLQDAGCFPPAPWFAALGEVNKLSSGACGLNDGSSAGQWRLPNLNELESLVDVSANVPALNANSPFINVSSAIYWSSTSYFGGEADSPDAWAIRFSDGRYMNDSTSNVKATANNEIWAVKRRSGGQVKLQATGMHFAYANGDDGSLQTGVPFPYPRWIDKRNGTLTDTVTGLIWLKTANCISGQWSEAITAISALATGQCGLADGSIAGSWRMPNRNEMLSLSDRMQNNHADFFNQAYTWKATHALSQAPIFTGFVVSNYYWTSTTFAADTSEAWTVYSRDFGVYDISKPTPVIRWRFGKAFN
jgi:hypothetical protein